MDQFPTLTEAAIRARASEQSYSRGYSYFRNGSVQDLVWRDGILTADVQGSDYNPYQVQVLFEGNEIVDATCPCR